MQKNTSISLGNHFDHFVSSLVSSGRYGSVSETIRSALRLLENRENKIKALNTALENGEKSGRSDYSLESLIAELDAE